MWDGDLFTRDCPDCEAGRGPFLAIPECNEATRNGYEGCKDGLGPKAAQRSIAKVGSSVFCLKKDGFVDI